MRRKPDGKPLPPAVHECTISKQDNLRSAEPMEIDFENTYGNRWIFCSELQNAIGRPCCIANTVSTELPPQTRAASYRGRGIYGFVKRELNTTDNERRGPRSRAVPVERFRQNENVGN